MDCESGKHPKVMFFLPPGSAKSTYGSMLFPPWFLARNPGLSVLAASHNLSLAERWGRRARNLIEEKTRILGVGTNPDNRSAGKWQLGVRPGFEDNPTLMGEYLAAGAGSAIAGFRGDLGLIDDPVSGREEVISELNRDKLWDWYGYDYKPRLKPNARQVVIMTRWHEDDLAGRILADEPGEWHVVSVPMVAESTNDPLGRKIGERLWPEWFTDKMVADAKKRSSVWLSLYQQRPTVEDGTYWQRGWLHPVEPKQVPPKHLLRIYGGTDYAVSEDKGDYTVHVVIGLDPEDRPWLLDFWREQTKSNVWVDAWCELVKWYRPLQWAEERGQIIGGVGPFLEREARKQRAHTERIQFNTSAGGKAVRAQSMRGHIATHGLWYDRTLPGIDDAVAELMAFPAGKHDDFHDALGLVGQLLDFALQGKHPKQDQTRKKSGYKTASSAVASQEAWKTR